MTADNITRKGKIARLPRAIREDLNTRLHDGKVGRSLLPWLNGLPEVRAVLAAHFDGDPINEQNLSAWKQGGYLEWCKHQAEADRLRAYAELSSKLVEATGLKLSDGAAAIAAGNLLARLEGAAPGADQSEIIKQIAALRAGDHSVHEGELKRRKLDLEREKADLKKRQIILQEEKFRRMLIEKLIDTAKQPEVQRILTSGKPKTVQMALLHKELFGEEGE